MKKVISALLIFFICSFSTVVYAETNSSASAVQVINPGGTYIGGVEVVLTSIETASIYYTLDGSDPNTESALYKAPIYISESCILKYIAVESTGTQCPVETQTYSIQPLQNNPEFDNPLFPVNKDMLLEMKTTDSGTDFYRYTISQKTSELIGHYNRINYQGFWYKGVMTGGNCAVIRFWDNNWANSTIVLINLLTGELKELADPGIEDWLNYDTDGKYVVWKDFKLNKIVIYDVEKDNIIKEIDNNSAYNLTINEGYITYSVPGNSSIGMYSIKDDTTTMIDMTGYLLDYNACFDSGYIYSPISKSNRDVWEYPAPGFYKVNVNTSAIEQVPSTSGVLWENFHTYKGRLIYVNNVNYDFGTFIYNTQESRIEGVIAGTPSYFEDNVLTYLNANGKYTFEILPPIGDTEPPVVSLTSPSGLTNDNTPLLEYSITDQSTFNVVVKVDGTVVNKVYGDSLDTLSDGPHTIRVEATDASGNVGFAESNFTVDSTPPVVTVSPAAGTYDRALTVTLTTDEPATIYYTTDGTAPTINSTQYAGPITVNTTTTLNILATDTAGNQTLQTEIHTIQYPTTLTYSGPTSSQANTPITVTGQLTVSNGGPSDLSNRQLIFNIGTESFSALTDSTGMASTTITLTQPAGTYPFTVSFNGDANLASSSLNSNFYVTNGNQTVKPTVNISNVSLLYDDVTKTCTAYINGLTTPPGSRVTVSATVKGAYSSTVTVTSNGNDWSCIITGLPTTGTLQVDAVAIDIAGNTSQPSSATANLKSVTPLGMSILNTSVSSDPITGTYTLTVTGTVKEGSSVTVSFDGGVSEPAVVDGNTWTYIKAGLTTGNYSITATANDQFGNTETVKDVIKVSSKTANSKKRSG